MIYIGHTNNLKRRQYQHNYNYEKGGEKELYTYIRSLKLDNVYLYLCPIQSFDTKEEASHYELYLILQDHFGRKELKQSLPKSVRYF